MKIKELDDFLSYVENPFFNKGRYRKECVILLKNLKKYAPEFDGEGIRKENQYVYVFPNSPFNERRLDQVIVELNRLLRQFFLIEHYLSPGKEVETQLEFAHVLRKKGHTQKSYSLVETILNQIEKQSIKSRVDYELLYKASSLLATLKSFETHLRDDQNIKNTLQYLEYYYYFNRLQLLNGLLRISKTSKVASKLNIEKEIAIVNLFDVELQDSPSLYIAQKLFILYVKGNVEKEDFDGILNILLHYEKLIDEESLKAYFTMVRNYCASLINIGKSELCPTLHKIQKDNLGKGYFYHSGQILPNAFYMITYNASVIKEFSWARNFIESHKDRIFGDNETKDYYRLTLANFLYDTGQKEEAIDWIPQTFQHIEFLLIAKTLEIRIYYDLKSDLLGYKLDAFKVYLARASKTILSDETRERYGNFVNFLYQIIHCAPGNKKKAEKIVLKIQETGPVVQREWLIEKARELK